MKPAYVYILLIFLSGIYLFISFLIIKDKYPVLQYQETFIMDQFKIKEFTINATAVHRKKTFYMVFSGETRFGPSFLRLKVTEAPEGSTLSNLATEWASAKETAPKDSLVKVWCSPNLKQSYLWKQGQKSFRAMDIYLGDFIFSLVGILSFTIVTIMFIRFLFKRP
jgi:hypothetical protein